MMKSNKIIMSMFIIFSLILFRGRLVSAQEVIKMEDSNVIKFEMVEENELEKDNFIMRSFSVDKRSANGTYESTYDMTGGVYSKITWTTDGQATFDVFVNPSEGREGTILTVFLQKSKSFNSWVDVESGEVDSVDGGSVTLNASEAGTYRIYLRNWTGFRVKGDISINYSA